jgi:hypothetical protein
MTEFTPLTRFRKLITSVAALATSFGNQLQSRGFKAGGISGQVPIKTGNEDYQWTWGNVVSTTMGFANITNKPTTLTGYGIADAVPVTRKVNGRELTSNINILAADVGAPSITGAVFTGPISATNLTGANTGDETQNTIKSKLGISVLSGANTGDQDITVKTDKPLHLSSPPVEGMTISGTLSPDATGNIPYQGLDANGLPKWSTGSAYPRIEIYKQVALQQNWVIRYSTSSVDFKEWKSAQTSSVMSPELATGWYGWTPELYAIPPTGTPVVTKLTPTAGTQGQFAIVSDGNNPRRFFINGSSSSTPSWQELALLTRGNPIKQTGNTGIPTSTAGLLSGDIWSDSGTLKIIP